MAKKVIIHSDGACLGNPGPGGWAAVLEYPSSIDGVPKTATRIVSGFVDYETTNNQMELLAAIKGIAALKKSCTVELYTDSKYVVKGMTEWIHNWRKNGWKTSRNKPIKNQDLWIQLYDVAKVGHHVTFHWVPGHSGIRQNEIADAKALEEAYAADFKIKNGYERKAH